MAMPKNREAEGKEQKESWIKEKLVVEAQQLEEVRENIAKLAPHINHIEEEPQISEDVASIGVHSPQQQAASVITAGPTIVLPLTSGQIKIGLHKHFFEAIRWLAVWCVKIAAQAKKAGLAVIFGHGKPVTAQEIIKDEKEAGIV